MIKINIWKRKNRPPKEPIRWGALMGRIGHGVNTFLTHAILLLGILVIFAFGLMAFLKETDATHPFIGDVRKFWRSEVATWSCSDSCESRPEQTPTRLLEPMPQPKTPVPHVPQGMAEQLAALVATAFVEANGDERKIKEWSEAFLRLPLRHLPEQEREKLFAIIVKVDTSWTKIFHAKCYQQRTCITFDDDVQRFFYERQLKGGDAERVVYNFWGGQLLRVLGKTAAYEKSAKYTLGLLETTTPAYEAMYRAHLPKPETP